VRFDRPAVCAIDPDRTNGMATPTMPKTTSESKTVTTSRPVLEVVGGVDTHADVHRVAALDQIGGLLGTVMLRATAEGSRWWRLDPPDRAARRARRV
jgi:hypothetical protein